MASKATPTSTSMKPARKSNKPLMEKRRRERINVCLDQLKSFLMEVTDKESSFYSKLEKADILELTVKYLKSMKKDQSNTTHMEKTTIYPDKFDENKLDMKHSEISTSEVNNCHPGVRMIPFRLANGQIIYILASHNSNNVVAKDFSCKTNTSDMVAESNSYVEELFPERHTFNKNQEWHFVETRKQSFTNHENYCVSEITSSTDAYLDEVQLGDPEIQKCGYSVHPETKILTENSDLNFEKEELNCSTINHKLSNGSLISNFKMAASESERVKNVLRPGEHISYFKTNNRTSVPLDVQTFSNTSAVNEDCNYSGNNNANPEIKVFCESYTPTYNDLNSVASCHVENNTWRIRNNANVTTYQNIERNDCLSYRKTNNIIGNSSNSCLENKSTKAAASGVSCDITTNFTPITYQKNADSVFGSQKEKCSTPFSSQPNRISMECTRILQKYNLSANSAQFLDFNNNQSMWRPW